MSDHDREKPADEAGKDPRRASDSESRKPANETLPPAGPHARPELTDSEKTPGTGMLPEPGDSNPSPTG
ncbi:hypothetical protein [Bradyrhizobium sp. USDA 4353]